MATFLYVLSSSAALATTHGESLQPVGPDYSKLLIALSPFGVVPDVQAAAYLDDGRYRYNVTGSGDKRGLAFVKTVPQGIHVMHVEVDEVPLRFVSSKRASPKKGYYEANKEKILSWQRSYQKEYGRAHTAANRGPDRFPFPVAHSSFVLGFLPSGFEHITLPQDTQKQLLSSIESELQLPPTELLSAFQPKTPPSNSRVSTESYVVFQQVGGTGKRRRGIAAWDHGGLAKAYAPPVFFLRSRPHSR